MTDVTRGLIGRRVCGGIEIGVGVIIGAISSANILSILSGVLIVVTGVLGILSKNQRLVIAYMVTGIICALLLAISVIASVILIVSYSDAFTEDSTVLIIAIVAVVITALLLIVVVLGVVFACLPFCGNSQGQDGVAQNNFTTSAGTGAPPNYHNTAYLGTKPGPV